MKKIGIVLVLVCCGLGILFFLKSRQEPAVQAADLLPADVLFYGEQHEFTEVYQDFLNSRFGKALIGLDYSAIEAELSGAEERVQETENFWKKVNTVLESPGFNEFLGKEFAAALFPAKSFSTENPAKALEERLLLIARPRHNAQVLQFLVSFFSKDIEQSTVQYGAHTISRYQLDKDYRLSTATVQGLVLAGFDERLVRKSLDFHDNRKDTLSGNKDFQRLRKNFKGSELFAYLSLPALFDQGRMIAGNLPQESREEFYTLLNQWEGWGGAAYGAWHEKGLLKDKAEILFDRSKLDSGLAKLCDVHPAENKSLAMVPADSLFYYWTNILNLRVVWEMYAAQVTDRQPDAFDVLRQELRDGGNVELEELLDMIGNEFAVIVRDVGREGIPLPKAAAIIQLKEPQRFLGVFNKLLEEAAIPISEKKYKGQAITYWGIAPQSGLQPAFTLIGNYLLLSNSYELVQQIVALRTDPSKALLESPDLREVGGKLLEKNNSTTYIHIALFADALKELATWAGSMAILQGPEMAHNAEIVVNKLLLPLLDGVAMYNQYGSRSIITNDSIVLESTTIVVQ